jgi:hypothetical protein
MGESITDLNQFKKRVLVFSDVSGIASGGRSTGKIETRKTVHALAFHMTDGGVNLARADFLTDIGSVVIRADGIVIRELTAQQLLDLYKHYFDDSVAFTPAGILLIPFAQSAFDLAQINNEYALGMLRNGKPLTLTYEINYKVATLKVDKIQVRAIVDDREREFGLHTRITPHTRSFGSTGVQDITDLPKGDGSSSLLAYHIVLPGTAGTISEITVKEGSNEVYNQVSKELLELLMNGAGRKAQTGYFHIPFNLDNDPRSKQYLSPATAHWLVQPNWSVAPNPTSFTILEEREHAGF